MHLFLDITCVSTPPPRDWPCGTLWGLLRNGSRALILSLFIVLLLFAQLLSKELSWPSWSQYTFVPAP